MPPFHPTINAESFRPQWVLEQTPPENNSSRRMLKWTRTKSSEAPNCRKMRDPFSRHRNIRILPLSADVQPTGTGFRPGNFFGSQTQQKKNSNFRRTSVPRKILFRYDNDVISIEWKPHQRLCPLQESVKSAYSDGMTETFGRPESPNLPGQEITKGNLFFQVAGN